MRVLVVNTGSSSLKMRAVEASGNITFEHTIDDWDGESGVGEAVTEAGEVDAIGHRVVHGGEEFPGPVRIEADVLQHIDELTSLAPLHQPRAVGAIRAIDRSRADVVQVACFDTSYHQTMPPAAATYALPKKWRAQWPLRRYGFHGLSHSYAARRAAELVGSDPEQLRVVTCHLGAGSSLCASVSGRSVETSMGFTPLEGVVMATRSGSVDPGLVLWLVGQEGLDAASVTRSLEKESGLKGLFGGTGDIREVLAALDEGDESARLAFDVYVHRLRGELARITASMGRLDVLAFTGGVGEHSAPVRQAVADGAGFLGVDVDRDLNAAAQPDVEVSATGAAVRTLVIKAGEEQEVARQVRGVLGSSDERRRVT